MSFSDDIAKFAVKVQTRSDSVVRSTVFKIMERIDMRSPVGNPALWKSKPSKGYVGGHFRANWQLGIGSLAGGEIAGHNYSVALSREKAKMPEKAAGKVFYYGNNLPYAQVLENGFTGKSGSRQAPHGMVGITVVEFGGIVNQAVAEVNK